MSTELGNQGAPIPLVVNGVTYNLDHWTLKHQDEYTAYMLARALDGAGKMRARVGDEHYVVLLSKIDEAYAAGHYDCPGPQFKATMKRDAGLIQFLWQQLKPNHPDITKEKVTELLATDMPACASCVFGRVLGKSLPPQMGAKGETSSDPSSANPAT